MPQGRPEFKSEEYDFLKSHLSLDMMDLDEQVMQLPVLIQRASEAASEAIEIRETAKDDLELAQSIAADKLRGVQTPKGKWRTETQITSEIPIDSDVQKKKEALSLARLDASLWQSLVEGFRSKNSAIRVVADLLNAGYMTPASIQEKRRQDLNARRKEVLSSQ